MVHSKFERRSSRRGCQVGEHSPPLYQPACYMQGLERTSNINLMVIQTFPEAEETSPSCDVAPLLERNVWHHDVTHLSEDLSWWEVTGGPKQDNISCKQQPTICYWTLLPVSTTVCCRHRTVSVWQPKMKIGNYGMCYLERCRSTGEGGRPWQTHEEFHLSGARGSRHLPSPEI